MTWLLLILVAGNRMFNPASDINGGCVKFRWWVSVGDWHWDADALELSVRVGKAKFWAPAAVLDAAIVSPGSPGDRYYVTFWGTNYSLPIFGGQKRKRTTFEIGGQEYPGDAAHAHVLNLQPYEFINGFKGAMDSLGTEALCQAWCYLLTALPGGIGQLLDYVSGWQVRTRCRVGSTWNFAQDWPVLDSTLPTSIMFLSEIDPLQLWDPNRELRLSQLGPIHFGGLPVLQFPIHLDWFNAIEGLPIYYGTYLAFWGLHELYPIIPAGFNLPSVRCAEVTSTEALRRIDSLLQVINVDIFSPVGWSNPPALGNIFEVAKTYAPTGCWGPLFPRNGQALHLDEYSTRAKIAIQGVTRFFDMAYAGDTTNVTTIPGFNMPSTAFRGWMRFTRNLRPGDKMRYQLQMWLPRMTRCFEIGEQELSWAGLHPTTDIPSTVSFVLWIYVQCETRVVFYIDLNQQGIQPNCGCTGGA